VYVVPSLQTAVTAAAVLPLAPFVVVCSVLGVAGFDVDVWAKAAPPVAQVAAITNAVISLFIMDLRRS
jgi:hypothetical protein